MQTLLEKFLSIKGQRVALVIERPVKTLKSFSGVITKRTVTSGFRAGVSYDNVAEVKEKRENGELPAENAGLPWGEWEIFPHIIKHKGKRYFRFQKMAHGQTKVRYFLNGKEVPVELVKPVAQASEFAKKDDCLCMSIGEDNVKRLQGIDK